ncbi:Kalirin, partial [Dissostichus eleginoides]
MKALQKNQGRTDQMLGAMADVLTSVAMPNQQWLSEGGEVDLPSSEEEKGPVQGQWDQRGWSGSSSPLQQKTQSGEKEQLEKRLCHQLIRQTLDIMEKAAEIAEIEVGFACGARAALSSFGAEHSIVSDEGAVCPDPRTGPSHSLKNTAVQRGRADSYSAAGSEGSISTSVASLPPQASGSSAPSSPGSRRSVSTLKKWLTNPVRKLSVGATAKGERQVRKLEGKPPPPPSQSHSLDLGSPPRHDDTFTILPITHRELEWKDGLASPEDLSPATLQSPSYITDSMIGCTSLPNTQRDGGIFSCGLCHGTSGSDQGAGETCQPGCSTPSRARRDGGARFFMEPDTESTSVLPDDSGSVLMDDTSSQWSTAADTEEERRSALEKSTYVLQELIETEKHYVVDLGLIVE